MYSNCAFSFRMHPLYTGPQAGPSRPSLRAGRGGSTRGRSGRRAPIIEEESSEEKEPAHPQTETSAGREDNSGSGSGSGDDTKEDSEAGDSDSDDDDGVEVVPQKRTNRASYSCAC